MTSGTVPVGNVLGKCRSQSGDAVWFAITNGNVPVICVASINTTDK